MGSAIVLAAGASKRMGGKDKLSLPYGKSTILKSTIQHILESQFKEVLVVASSATYDFCNTIIKDLGSSKVKIVVNLESQKGMTSSIQLGVKLLNKESKFAFVCLGDMPSISASTYNLLIDELITSDKSILQPYWKRKPGNPVGFKAIHYTDILKVQNPNGCADVLINNTDKIITIDCDDESIVLDVDDTLSYEHIITRLSNSLTDK